MKKIFALLLVLVLAFSIISCDFLNFGDSGNNDGAGEGTNDGGNNNGGNTGNNNNNNSDPEKDDNDAVVDTPIIDWEAD